MGFFDVINKGFDVVNDGMARASGNIINGFISPFVKIGNEISRDVERAKRGQRFGLATGGTILRTPAHHGMAGRTSFEAHSKGMSHQFKPVGQSFAQASFAQGGYFPGADHRLI